MANNGCKTTIPTITASTVIINRVEFTLATKVDGNVGSPVAGQYTYQNNLLRGALDIQYIFVEKEIKTIIDDDFIFDSATGTITRPVAWASGDSLIIHYAKSYDTTALWSDGGSLPAGPKGDTGEQGPPGPSSIILPIEEAFIQVDSGVAQSFSFSPALQYVINTDGAKVFYNLLDRTGELLTVEVVTTLPSGAAITDADVDNVIYFKNKPLDGGGYSKRVITDHYNVLWFGAKGDSDLTGNPGTDNHLAIQAAIDAVPNASVLYFPTGVYATSRGFNISKVLHILGEGSAIHRNMCILPNASFPTNEPLFNFINASGRSSIRYVASPMNLRGGTWAQFTGEGGSYLIERNYVSGVTAGNWGIDFIDPEPGASNGAAALTNILENSFSTFEGGAIRAEFGGDSCNILRNLFQLGNSSSHILYWKGVLGAFCLNFCENNATGASKFIEIFTAVGCKISKNQFEATVPIDNTANAMVCIHGTLTEGYTDSADISDNNFGGHNNVASAIYLDKAWYTFIKNNHATSLTNLLRTDTLTRRCTVFMGGTFTGVTTIVDPANAVTVFNPYLETYLQGSIRMRGSNPGNPSINFSAGRGADAASALYLDAPDAYNSAASINLFRFTGDGDIQGGGGGVGSTGVRLFRIFDGRGTSAIQHSFSTTGAAINILQGFLAIGLATALAKLHLSGQCQLTSEFNTANGIGLDNVILLDSTTSGAGCGGAILFAGSGYRGATMKFLLLNGIDNGVGDLAFSTRRVSTDSTLTEALRIRYNGNIGIDISQGGNPTNDLSFGRSKDRKIWVENSLTDVAGKVMTLAAGSAIAGTSVSDIVGGELIFEAGKGTGSAAAAIRFKLPEPLSSGTTLQTLVERLTLLGNGFIGIGITSPTGKLDISDLRAIFPNIAVTAFRSVIEGEGNAGGSSVLRGADISAKVTGVNNASLQAIIATAYCSSTSGTIAIATGVAASVRHDNAAAVTTAFGVSSSPLLSSTGNMTAFRSIYAGTPQVSSSGVITNSYGLYLDAQKTTGVTNGWGVYQVNSTDINYFNGKVGVGTNAPDASSILDVNSTTLGARPVPRMTTAQRTAISSPATGIKVYDTDLKREFWWDVAWKTIEATETGAVAPASTPAVVGDKYVDTVAKKIYFATGTASSADWTIIN